MLILLKKEMQARIEELEQELLADKDHIKRFENFREDYMKRMEVKDPRQTICQIIEKIPQLPQLTNSIFRKLKKMSKLDKEKAVDPFHDYKLDKKSFDVKLCEKRWSRVRRKKKKKHYN